MADLGYSQATADLIERMCSIPSCSRKFKARNMCDMHLMRLYRNGSPHKVQRKRLGLSATTEYNSWRAMKERCTNPNHEAYRNYGGRGITVCSRWLHDFEAFLQDMGQKPRGITLERKDNDGNYEPSNCKWATRKEQRSNTRG